MTGRGQILAVELGVRTGAGHY